MPTFNNANPSRWGRMWVTLEVFETKTEAQKAKAKYPEFKLRVSWHKGKYLLNRLVG